MVRNGKNSDDDHIGHHDNAYGPGKKSHSGKPENEHDVGFPRRGKKKNPLLLLLVKSGGRI